MQSKKKKDKTDEAMAMFNHLIKVIGDFEKDLEKNKEIAYRLVHFGNSIEFNVEKMTYLKPDLFIFTGNLKGEPIELIQHLSQLNILLRAVEKQNPKEPRAKIGFFVK